MQDKDLIYNVTVGLIAKLRSILDDAGYSDVQVALRSPHLYAPAKSVNVWKRGDAVVWVGSGGDFRYRLEYNVDIITYDANEREKLTGLIISRILAGWKDIYTEGIVNLNPRGFSDETQIDQDGRPVYVERIIFVIEASKYES